MVKVLLTSVIGLVSISAQAALSDSCKQLIESNYSSCANSTAQLTVQDYGMPDSCIEARGDGREQVVASYSKNNVILTIDKSSICESSMAVIPSPVVEAKQMAGRVIMRAQDGKLYIVGRNGSTAEVLNKSRQSLSITDISVQDDSVLKVETSSGPFTWDLATIDAKVNGTTRTARILGGAR